MRLTHEEKLRRALVVARQRAARAHHWAFLARRAIDEAVAAGVALASTGYAKTARGAIRDTINEQASKARDAELASGWIEWTIGDLCVLMGGDGT